MLDTVTIVLVFGMSGIMGSSLFYRHYEIKNRTDVPMWLGCLVLIFFPIALILWKPCTSKLFQQYKK